MASDQSVCMRNCIFLQQLTSAEIMTTIFTFIDVKKYSNHIQVQKLYKILLIFTQWKKPSFSQFSPLVALHFGSSCILQQKAWVVQLAFFPHWMVELWA